MMMFDQYMLMADVSPAVSVAKNSAVHQSSASAPHAWGVCQLVKLNDQGEGDESLYDPLVEAKSYFREHDKKEVNIDTATVRVIEKPQHGKVELHVGGDIYETSDFVAEGFAGANYLPDHGFTGNDSMVLRVEGGDYSVDIHYFLRVIESQATTGDEMFQNPDCLGTNWIISGMPLQKPYNFGGDTLTNYLVKKVSVSVDIIKFGNGTVDKSADRNITLNYNDDGYGWFVATVPGEVLSNTSES